MKWAVSIEKSYTNLELKDEYFFSLSFSKVSFLLSKLTSATNVKNLQLLHAKIPQFTTIRESRSGFYSKRFCFVIKPSYRKERYDIFIFYCFMIMLNVIRVENGNRS